MWKPSLPHVLIKYLLHVTREASNADDVTCSFSSDTKWITHGNASTCVFLAPQS